jgi:hypothetical protein
MTIAKFFIIFFLQAVIFIALKVFFFDGFDYQAMHWKLLYWGATVGLAIALVRSLGVLNYLESIFIAFMWVVFNLLFDVLITRPLAGVSIFTTQALWVGYGVMALAIFWFHRKRHIHVREKLHAKHHGHH